nr:hypothetical protein [Deltaproteobacteria bacterium]
EVKYIMACYAEAEAERAQCLDPVMCPSDPSYACVDAYNAAIGMCGAVPLEVSAAMEEICEGKPPFVCSAGEKIPGQYRCDGPTECIDNSDEVDCPGRFTCPSGESIQIEWQCDGDSDCADSADEVGCPEWTCEDGEKIPDLWHCDGDQDCEDNSDEKNCVGQFTCVGGGSIPLGWKCDGNDDCSDASDEVDCP